jgi:multiple antibiotic resistance protein
MLSGPGAISTTVVLQSQARDIYERVALYLSILAVMAVTYIILRLSARGAKWLSPIVMSIAIRIMGLLLAAVAVQFMLNGLRDAHLWMNDPGPT